MNDSTNGNVSTNSSFSVTTSETTDESICNLSNLSPHRSSTPISLNPLFSANSINVAKKSLSMSVHQPSVNSGMQDAIPSTSTSIPPVEDAQNREAETTTVSISPVEDAQNQKAETTTISIPPLKDAQNVKVETGFTVPSPFKQILRYPVVEPLQKKKRKTREHVPFAITLKVFGENIIEKN